LTKYTYNNIVLRPPHICSTIYSLDSRSLRLTLLYLMLMVATSN